MACKECKVNNCKELRKNCWSAYIAMTQKKLETAIHTHFGKNLALTIDTW